MFRPSDHSWRSTSTPTSSDLSPTVLNDPDDPFSRRVENSEFEQHAAFGLESDHVIALPTKYTCSVHYGACSSLAKGRTRFTSPPVGRSDRFLAERVTR